MASTKVMVIILAVVRVTMSSVEVPKITLNDGNQIPSLALGTYGSDRDRARMRQAINWAVEAGYRHIDTASMYRNEVEIGQGIADVVNKGLVKREDLFVTTKLGHDKHAEQLVVPALRESLSRLGLDYVDLYLIHSPVSTTADGDPSHIDYLETWQGMEEAKSLGLAKSIGVSNFNTEQIDRLLAYSHFPPAVNQIEVHPSLTQTQLVAHNQERQIVVMAYGPFGFLVSRNRTYSAHPRADDPALTKIAQKYGKTPGQVVLRYLIDRGTIPIPKSTDQNHQRENIDVFDFKLTSDEIKTINNFNSNTKIYAGL